MFKKFGTEIKSDNKISMCERLAVFRLLFIQGQRILYGQKLEILTVKGAAVKKTVSTNHWEIK